MAEGKYGRLYAERDVLMLLKLAHEKGWKTRGSGGGLGFSSRDFLEEVEADPPSHLAPLTFPADEPVFVLRAQDEQAIEGLEGYQQACDVAGDVSTAHCEGVRQAWHAFTDWQHEHPERVGAPD